MATTYKMAPISSLGMATRDLEEDEYRSLLDAKLHARTILDAEENLELLLENYIEFESDLLDIALEQQVYKPYDWASGQIRIRGVNRRLANLLTAGRLYEDQIVEIVERLQWVERYKKDRFMDRHYTFLDGSLGTRVVRQLRNHIQHRRLPISDLSAGGKVTEDEDENKRQKEFRAIPLIDTKRLGEDARFNRDVLRELKDIGTKVPIVPMIRGYVEDIGDLHDSFRTETQDAAERSHDLLFRILSKTEEVFGNTVPGVTLLREIEGKLQFDVQIFPELLEYWKKVVMRNLDIVGLASGYVSGRSGVGDRQVDRD